MVKNFLIPLLIAGSLASCAPSMQASTPVVDPIFAPGQVWQVTWPEGDTTESTVPARDSKESRDANYEGEGRDPVTGSVVLTSFTYSPAGSSPEHILTSRLVIPKSLVPEPRFCIVRTPGKVNLNQTLVGAATKLPVPEMDVYIDTGVTTLPACSLKRVK